MRRPKQIPRRRGLTQGEIEAARYEGSLEHKNKRWWNGLPRHRKDPPATICPMRTPDERDQATCWVQEALIKGWYEFKEGDDIYPHFIWRIVGDKKAWKGRCINTTLGTYKGWPLQDDEHDEV